MKLELGEKKIDALTSAHLTQTCTRFFRRVAFGAAMNVSLSTGNSFSKEIHAKRVKKTFLAKSRQTLRGGIVPETKNIFFSKLDFFQNFFDIRAHREKASLRRLKLETQAPLNMPRQPHSRISVPPTRAEMTPVTCVYTLQASPLAAGGGEIKCRDRHGETVFRGS